MATNYRRPGVPTGRSDEAPELDARVITTVDGSTECTIFPAEISDDRLTTTWITAEEGSYVPLDETR